MTTIPDDIMKRARDLAYTGCGCDEVEAQTCEHVRECLCDFQTTAIARALMAERERVRNETLEEAANHVARFTPSHDDCHSDYTAGYRSGHENAVYDIRAMRTDNDKT